MSKPIQLHQEKPAEEDEIEEKSQADERESVKAPPPAPEKGKEKDKKDTKGTSKEIKVPAEKKQEKEKPKESEERPSGMIGKPEDDLTLRAAMYGVLFQSYADQVNFWIFISSLWITKLVWTINYIIFLKIGWERV